MFLSAQRISRSWLAARLLSAPGSRRGGHTRRRAFKPGDQRVQHCDWDMAAAAAESGAGFVQESEEVVYQVLAHA